METSNSVPPAIARMRWSGDSRLYVRSIREMVEDIVARRVEIL